MPSGMASSASPRASSRACAWRRTPGCICSAHTGQRGGGGGGDYSVVCACVLPAVCWAAHSSPAVSSIFHSIFHFQRQALSWPQCRHQTASHCLQATLDTSIICPFCGGARAPDIAACNNEQWQVARAPVTSIPSKLKEMPAAHSFPIPMQV